MSSKQKDALLLLAESSATDNTTSSPSTSTSSSSSSSSSSDNKNNNNNNNNNNKRKLQTSTPANAKRQRRQPSVDSQIPDEADTISALSACPPEVCHDTAAASSCSLAMCEGMSSADKAKLRRQRHNEVELKRRRRMKERFDELKRLTRCVSSKKECILSAAIGKITELNAFKRASLAGAMPHSQFAAAAATAARGRRVQSAAHTIKHENGAQVQPQQQATQQQQQPPKSSVSQDNAGSQVLLASLSGRFVCMLCFSNSPNVAVAPCNHACYCSQCAATMGKLVRGCPLCGIAAQSLVTLDSNAKADASNKAVVVPSCGVCSVQSRPASSPASSSSTSSLSSSASSAPVTHAVEHRCGHFSVAHLALPNCSGSSSHAESDQDCALCLVGANSSVLRLKCGHYVLRTPKLSYTRDPLPHVKIGN